MNPILSTKEQLSIKQYYLSIFISFYVGGLLNLINLYRVYSQGGLHDGYQTILSSIVMVTFCYFLLELISIGGRFAYKLFGSMLLLFSAAASYYMIFFNVVVGYGVIASVLNVTDFELAGESVGYKFVLWLLVFGLLPLILLIRTKMRATFWSQVFSKSRGVFMIPALIISVFIVKISVETIDDIGFKNFAKQNRYTAVPSGVMVSSYLPTNWISGLMIFAYQEYGAQQKDLINPAELFDYVEKTPMDDTYVVFVLGETTRSDHMQILGYERETNPMLSKEPNLVALNGIACDTATLLSMRCMFVRQGGADESNQREVKENNIFNVLGQLGFSSELYAMQSEVWFYNTVGADYYEMREALAANIDSKTSNFDDMILLDYLEKSVDRHPKGKHLVILHTKGSHYSYSQRYPRDFAHFLPDCGNIDSKCTLDAQINSFDNSVRYVDLFLSKIFDQLRDKKAIVFYAADHGESIKKNTHFHGTPKEMAPEEQFMVPLLVWASDKYLTDPIRNQAFNNLKAKQMNSGSGIHEEIYDSMLGCLGYESPNGGINAENNWCAGE